MSGGGRAGAVASAVREGYLAGKVAVVTGGRGGIGTAVCARFAAEGAAVYATGLSGPTAGAGAGADTDAAPGAGANADAAAGTDSGADAGARNDVDAGAAAHAGAGTDAGAGAAAHAAPAPVAGAVLFHRHDVTSEESTVALMARVSREHGRLDVLVNAAGIEIEKTVEHTSLDEWNRIFAVNVTGTFLTSKHALPLMRRAGGGSIINFGSYDGFIADPNLAAYCATKGAVHALTRAMACDHGPDNIRVNAICPGYVDTPMLKSFFDAKGDAEAARMRDEARLVHPLRRYGTPEDMANLVNWLAGDEARYATGQLWVLDGGISAQVQQMRV